MSLSEKMDNYHKKTKLSILFVTFSIYYCKLYIY